MTEKTNFDICEEHEEQDFDELLLHYAALNRKYELMEEFNSCAKQAEEEGIEPSPELDAAIYSMIDDLAKKGKKIKTKRRYRKGFTVAAILCLILLACPAIAFAVSPAFRINFMEMVSDWQDDHVSFRMSESNNTEWLPEGFTLVQEETSGKITITKYINNDEFINLIVNTNVANININNENNTYYEEYEINGRPAIVTQQPDLINIIWNDDNSMFQLTTNLSLETALNMAKKIQ